MNVELVKRFMKIVEKHSPNCFINSNFEVIIEPKNNIFFRLEDIETELDLKRKILSWLSRPSHKGISDYWQKRIRRIVNEFLGTNFTYSEMMEIYTHFGLGLNRDKCIKFIKSNYDFSTLSS